MASFFQGTDPDVDAGGAQQSAQLAEEWATKLDGPVQDSSYSAHYHANAAATSATNASASASAAASSAQSAADSAAALASLALDDISNVTVPSPNDGDILTWVAANSAWEPVAAVAASNQSIQSLYARMQEMEDKLKAAGLL
jgi:hypothetical protein